MPARSMVLFLLCLLSATAQRRDAWRVIGPGGGGAQFFPTISPHDSRVVLVRCDMTGSYISQDGGETWRMFNLRAPADFYVFDPSDPKTIYVHTMALFVTHDTGRTWQLLYPSPKNVRKISKAGDHADEEIVTNDGSKDKITALAVDPTDSKRLYAAMNTGFAISSNRGETWTKESGGPTGGKWICVSPRDSTVYVVGANSVAVRDKRGWTQHKPPAGVERFTDVSAGFGAGGSKPIIYALGPELVISRDGGETWTKANSGLPNLRAVAMSAKHPEVAYLSYSGLREGLSSFHGVAKTTDAGQTWTAMWKESDKAANNISDPWITARFGTGWGENPLSLGVDPNNPDICYGTDLGRTMRTTDGGKTWRGVYSTKVADGYTTTGLDVTTSYGVHFDPFDVRRMFISYTDIGLFRSENGGTSWISATIGVPRPWVNTTYWVEFDPAVRNRMWGVMSGTHDLPRPKMWRRTSPQKFVGGVSLSEDGGRTWRVSGEGTQPGMPPTAATHILLDPSSPKEARVLYVTGFGRGVFKSTDGGSSWTMKNTGITQKEPFAWRLARDRNGTLYLVIARRSEDGSIDNESDGALYRSRDGAEHWEPVALPPGVNGPNGIAVDPENPERLYLAAWARREGEDGEGGGIFLSTDGGRNWRRALERDRHVYDVTVDPRNPAVLYACGFTSSAWRSSNRGETWQRIPGFNFKWGHRVIPDPRDAQKIYITTFGGSVWYGPAQGDPEALEDIVTPQVAPAARK